VGIATGREPELQAALKLQAVSVFSVTVVSGVLKRELRTRRRRSRAPAAGPWSAILKPNEEAVRDRVNFSRQEVGAMNVREALDARCSCRDRTAKLLTVREL
jgi:hypothetical protein